MLLSTMVDRNWLILKDQIRRKKYLVQVRHILSTIISIVLMVCYSFTFTMQCSNKYTFSNTFLQAVFNCL